MHPKRTQAQRWWAQLAAYRALEHDGDGRLLWETVVLTTSRQVGKSWLIRELCMWRLDQAERLGEVQTVVHAAAQLKHAYRQWAPAARWARNNGYRVRWTNGEQCIEAADGSGWLIQAANDGLGVSLSVGLAIVDEAWDVPRELIEHGLEPTMAEAVDPQMWLVSTAGVPRAGEVSDLVPTNRDAAIEQLDDPGSTLLLEWSAAPGDDIDDPAAWRSASPHWDERRQRTLEGKRSKATTEKALKAFRVQWLNQWPPVAKEERSNAWLPEASVDACARDRVVPGGRVAAVERLLESDLFSAVHGGASGVEVLPARGLAEVVPWLVARDPEVVLCHQAVANLLPESLTTRVVKAGEASAAVTALADAVRAGAVAFDRGPEVAAQFADTVVAAGETGPRISAKASRGDVSCVKALSWLVWWAEHAAPESAEVF
jgi:hypothetical protein